MAGVDTGHKDEKRLSAREVASKLCCKEAERRCLRCVTIENSPRRMALIDVVGRNSMPITSRGCCSCAKELRTVRLLLQPPHVELRLLSTYCWYRPSSLPPSPVTNSSSTQQRTMSGSLWVRSPQTAAYKMVRHKMDATGLSCLRATMW